MNGSSAFKLSVLLVKIGLYSDDMIITNSVQLSLLFISIFSGALAFDMEYARWLDEHHRQINDLRSAVNSHVGENELCVLVEGVMGHYDEFFEECSFKN